MMTRPPTKATVPDVMREAWMSLWWFTPDTTNDIPARDATAPNINKNTYITGPLPPI